MYPISADCAAALVKSHTRSVVAELYDGFGPIIASTYGTPRIEVGIEGSVKVAAKAVHSRSFTCNIYDTDGSLAPGDNQSMFDPLARPQIRLFSKIEWVSDDGTPMSETVPIGVFNLDKNSLEEMGSGSNMSLSGNSRNSSSIQTHPWLRPYNLAEGVTWDKGIQFALQNRAYPGWRQRFKFETSKHLTPKGVVFGADGSSDPWADLQKMADDDGTELLEDASGAFILRTIPDVRANPHQADWVIDESPTSPRLTTKFNRDIDRANTFNGVVVNGTAHWLVYPVQGVAWDTDPGSPTYYLGPFGMSPKTIDDSMVGSQDQADKAAKKKLGEILGVEEQITLDALPNPAAETGDYVRIVSTATGVSDIAILSDFEIPFDNSRAMSCTIKRRRS